MSGKCSSCYFIVADRKEDRKKKKENVPHVFLFVCCLSMYVCVYVYEKVRDLIIKIGKFPSWLSSNKPN